MDNSNETTEKELNYAALHFHSDKSNKLKSILPKDSEIILNPLNAPNNTNEGRGNDVTTDKLSVDNDYQHTQRKKSSKWQISYLVVVGGICAILLIAVVIVWSKEYKISQKGINSKYLSTINIITAYNSNLLSNFTYNIPVQLYNIILTGLTSN